MKKLLCGLLFWMVAYAQAATGAEPPLYRAFEIAVDHHGYPLEATLWIPSLPGGEVTEIGSRHIFDAVTGKIDGRVAKERFPVVVMSHALGANMESLAWLSAGIAQRGAITVAVNHPNSSEKDLDLQDAMEHWSRVNDLSAALDHVSNHPVYGKFIDAEKIYAVGVSLGGWTALSMAGLQGNQEGYASHCESKLATQDCKLIASMDLDIRNISESRWNRIFKDNRVVGAAAIDPLLTYGLDKTNVETIEKNILLIGLGQGSNRSRDSDFSEIGSNFVSLLPKAQSLTLYPANQFTITGTCVPGAAEKLQELTASPLCTDPAGTDRKAIHQAVIDAIAEKFKL